MALVPIIQPFAIKLVTTKKERKIKMPYNPKEVSQTAKIIFPIAVTIIAGLIAPQSLALVGFLMFETSSANARPGGARGDCTDRPGEHRHLIARNLNCFQNESR